MTAHDGYIMLSGTFGSNGGPLVVRKFDARGNVVSYPNPGGGCGHRKYRHVACGRVVCEDMVDDHRDSCARPARLETEFPGWQPKPIRRRKL